MQIILEASLFGLTGLYLIAAAVLRRYYRRKNKNITEAYPRIEEYIDIIVSTKESDGPQEYSIPGRKICIGTVRDPGPNLNTPEEYTESVDISDYQSGSAQKGSKFLKIEITDEGVFFRSPVVCLVNGVEVKEKKLLPGSKIVWGSSRITYKGIHTLTAYPEKKPNFFSVYHMPVLLTLLTLALVFSGRAMFVPAEIGRAEMGRAEIGGAEIGRDEIGRAEIGGAEIGRAEIGGAEIAKKSEEPVPEIVPPAEKAITEPDRLREYSQRHEVEAPLKLNMVKPGETPEFFDADIMCIHAHPDDEAIDFGGFIANASRKGKKIVVILFTDGEGGMVRSDFSIQNISPKELASIRVGETERALSRLGVERYVRLGLRNHPYYSSTQVLSNEEVLINWGGEHSLINTLEELIGSYNPSIVLSPDYDMKAHEHFEHKTVGYLTKKVLENIIYKGESSVKGHLVALDPESKEQNRTVVCLSGFQTAEEKLSPMTIKAQALQEYHTQQDASIIALERTLEHEQECYKIEFWDYSTHIEEFFAYND